MNFSKKSNYQLVLDIFKPNNNGISKWISRKELEKTPLALGNNGNTRHGICFGVSQFKWQIERKNEKKTGKIERIKIIGYNKTKTSRPIRTDIRKYFTSSVCVVCGNSDIIIDHKNDLYNDPRVLNKETQTKDDFQPLCNSCNLRKRQVCKKSKEIGKRYKATNIPMLKEFGIDFIKGDETLDLNKPDAMVGTYWYDPKAFMNFIIRQRIDNICKEFNKL